LGDAIRLVLRLLETNAYKDLIAERVAPTDDDLKSDDALDQYLLRTVGTARHVSGTCKMGPAGDPMALVNQRLQVHGLEGIRCADPSVLPNVTRANTNVTAIMIGERVSDWI
jgi:choline dehydrogenase